jgi:hypothetical protein
VGAVAFNNVLYAINGDTVWAYNGSSFDQKNSLASSHKGSQPENIGSLIYVAATGSGSPSSTLDAFAPDEVTWSSTGPNAADASIDQAGHISALARTDASTPTWVTLTATSQADNSITGSFQLTVVRKNQIITFGTLTDKTYGDADFMVSATASSGLAVTFTATGDCSVLGSTVHITGAGSCTVTAHQAGDDTTWAPGSDMPQPFTINARLATWTTNANSKTYGDLDPNPLTTGSGSNFVAGDGVTATYSRATGETVLGGPYHITATLNSTVANALNNYIITNTGASFTINARLATWTTNVNSKTYGDLDPNPLTTGSGSNFVAGDGVTATYSRATGETVLGGPYHITATLAPAGVLTNYTITNTGASFTIAKAVLTVKADNKTMVLHSALPIFTATYTGFKFSDAFASAVTGSPSLTTPATSASPAGTYTIAAALGTLAANNYTFAFGNGTLTVLYATGGMCAGDVGHAIRQPINVDGSSVFKIGSTVPTKFAVCDANGVSIGTPGVVTGYNLIAAGSSSGLSIDEDVYSTTPDTAFRWDPTGQQWIFNQSTKNNGTLNKTNTLYVFQINLNDGSWITFQYGLK